MKTPLLTIILFVQVLPTYAAELKPNAEVLDILKQAKQEWHAIRSEETDKDLIARQIAEAEARAGNIHAAMATVIANPDYRSILLAKIASVQAGRGDVKGAFRTADQITDAEDKVDALLAIAKAHHEAARREDTISAFNEAVEEVTPLKSLELQTKLFKAIAKAQNETGEWALAYVSVGMMPDSIEKAEVFSSLATQQIEKGNLKGARRIVDSILDEAIRDAVNRAIAAAQAEKGEFPEAFDTVGLIEDPFYKASALSWIGASQVKKGVPDEGLRTLQGAIRIARGMDEISKHKALLLKEIASAQWRAGFDSDAKQSFDEARRTAVQIPVDEDCTKCLVLNEIGEALSEAGYGKASQETLQDAKLAALKMNEDHYYRTTVLMRTAECQLKARQNPDALLTLQEAVRQARVIPRDVHKCSLYLEISVMCSKLGDVTTARELLQQATVLSAGIKEEDAKLAICINIAVTNIRLGFIKAALESTDQLEENDERAEVLSKITEERAEAGMAKEAYEIAREQRTPLLKAKALLGVAKGILDAGDRARRYKPVLRTEDEEEQESDVPEMGDNAFSSYEGDSPD